MSACMVMNRGIMSVRGDSEVQGSKVGCGDVESRDHNYPPIFALRLVSHSSCILQIDLLI